MTPNPPGRTERFIGYALALAAIWCWLVVPEVADAQVAAVLGLTAGLLIGDDP